MSSESDRLHDPGSSGSRESEPESRSPGSTESRKPKAESLLLVLSAPSGAGKTTLAHRLVDETPGAVFSVSWTTRAPRGQERDGVDYRFVTEAEFLARVREGAFVEHAFVHGCRYGTPRSVVEEALARGRLAVFDIDVQGGEQLKRAHPEAAAVMILPPSMAELERRLRGRGTDGDGVMARRLAAARAEVRRGCKSYDYCVVNDDLEWALGDLRAIVRAEGLRAGRIRPDAMGF